MEDFRKKYLQSLKDEEERQITENTELIHAFKQECEKIGIELSANDFHYIQTTGIVAWYPNIVTKLCPEIIIDKEGLVDFAFLVKHFDRKPFSNGLLYSEKFIMMAHPYFRRAYHQLNNFAPRFVEFFWGLKIKDIESYIALDLDRVRINVDGYGYMESDTWFGAKFSRSIGEIDDNITKLRPPMHLDAGIISFFFASAYSLDIKWSTKDNIKSFQAEEFKNEEVTISKNGLDYYPVRYVHAEFDLKQGVFRHFDGAIHLYTVDEYFMRRDSDFNYNSKNSLKIKTYSEKLFKINGKIDVNTWIEFTSHFFIGNPLIIEYFEGKYPEHILDMLQKVKDNETANDL